MYVLFNEENIIYAQYSELKYVPDSFKDKTVKVNDLPELDYTRIGKQPYYFYNGTSIEARYRDRPLTEKEEIVLLKQENTELKQQLEVTNQAIAEITMMITPSE